MILIFSLSVRTRVCFLVKQRGIDLKTRKTGSGKLSGTDYSMNRQ